MNYPRSWKRQTSFTIEMVERYSKEPGMTLEVFDDYRHTTALKEFYFPLILVPFYSV
ncbi:MAG: hypothetical protein P8M17_04430 [Saprospiraceae bacterium]|nr:hypothetical protein [Saprospiraceae bacterium]